ncbi:energy-coupling factor transporter transmembrane component T [Papillibacter cinnamivorans]|uniref:Energy-coupling factor transport system permease protein n=1 Tax=Papillibacter cinnamivorans DSM 12816 TaxID=1122930 RepID=A0A1W2CY61_9FIRM|nr:energy-coupling factor transporter transmembrane component T [Papillibacter cinnamivorans]SMC90157.1 energy-coupling factor transport system permease protein [Papillibacter cinnamivorans DSM 12816]
MRDAFSSYHPTVNLAYFAGIILLSMLLLHPYFLVFSFLGGLAYFLRLRGRGALRFCFLFLLPLMAAAAVLNPLFNHAGVTILAYLPDGNPVTLESICYGAAAAGMFGAVLLWFACCGDVMTSDKWIYLFGRIFPAQSLLLSMALRFIPRYQMQAGVISRSQACLGRGATGKGILRKARGGLRILSILTTWALENAIETADSMKARGYGLPGRTSFSLFRFDGRDRIVFFILMGLAAAAFWGLAAGAAGIRFFPSIHLPETTPSVVAIRILYPVLCFLPLILDAAEELQWTYIRSRL